MIFLVGGQDLEMLEIKHILDSKNIKYIDRQLSWGAKLSEYADVLKEDTLIYGIELEEDITPPKNYRAIDHHNQNSNKPSSLEQVAKILKIKLNRHQMLIAKNDSAYIDGMKCISATQEEIDTIRALDRKAQGVTTEDEILADKSIKNSNAKNVVYALTDKFTPISDKIYTKFSQYIIYNDFTVLFYGYELSYVIKFLKDKNLDENHFYYGGGENGFVGIQKGLLTKETLNHLIKEFRNYARKRDI